MLDTAGFWWSPPLPCFARAGQRAGGGERNIDADAEQEQLAATPSMQIWTRLEQIYTPWIRSDGDAPTTAKSSEFKGHC